MKSPTFLAAVPLLVAALAAFALTPACTTPETPAEGEGEGGEGEGEGGEGEGEGAEGEGEGAGCQATGCDDGEQCGSIFGPNLGPACFVSCSDGAVPCETANGLTGECRTAEAFADPFCRAEAPNLGPCGNVANSGCFDDGAVCAGFDDDALFPDDASICVITCAVDGDCGDTLGCSKDFLVLAPGEPEPRGICAPVTAVDSPCGRRGDGSLSFCTSGLQCDREDGETVGACVAP